MRPLSIIEGMSDDSLNIPVFSTVSGSATVSASAPTSGIASGIRKTLPALIDGKLRQLERMLRTYVTLDGLATTVVALGLIFWIDLALDRFFEPSRPLRLLLLLAMLAAVGTVVWVRILRRTFATIRNDQLAMVLERRIPRFNEALLTAVDLNDRLDTNVHPLFLEHTVDQAAETIATVNIRSLFKYRRLFGRTVLALAMAALVAGFCFAAPEAAGTWFSRNVLISTKEWPRTSRIFVEGFDTHGRARVARGDSLTMIVRADTAAPLVPDLVRLRLGSRQSGFRTVVLDQFRLDTTRDMECRTFVYTFSELLEDLDIAVHAGDTRLEGYRIEVVPPPVLMDVRLILSPPDYLRKPLDPPVRPTGRTLVPEGASIRVEASASKPLRRILVARDDEEPQTVFETPEGSTDLRDRFTFHQDDLRADTSLTLTLEDGDGLRNRHPIRFDFAILKDAPPQVAVRLAGIGNAITPMAILPTEGEITDDYAINSLFYAYTVVRGVAPETSSDGNPSDEAAKDGTPEGGKVLEDFEGTETIADRADRALFPLNRVFSVQELNLRPGDRLTLVVEATDDYHLPGMETHGQRGSGDRWQLDVVTPEQLKTMLEVKEITLRQRFEVLIDEVKRTRVLAEEFPLDAVAEDAENSENSKTGENDILTEISESIENQQDQGRAEGMETTEMELQRQIEEQRRLRRERVSAEQATTGIYNLTRSLRDTQKETYEIGTILQAFLDIRREMENNRILTPEMRQRLDEGIAGPIRSLLDTDFAELDRRLLDLRRMLEERETTVRTDTVGRRDEVLEQFDRVLERMAMIRDSMLSMESYAEAIELLRIIIREQEELRKETQEKRRDQLRELLD